MATFQFFDREVGGVDFSVWATDGLLQFLVNGQIRHDIDSVSDFLVEAAKVINKPNATDDVIVEKLGSLNDNAVENFQDGVVALDTGGTNPSIVLQDDSTEVKFGGSGVGGSLRIDFGTGASAQAEAAEFKGFAEDLLGKAQTTLVETLTGIEIGDYTRTVTVSTRDDDIQQVKFKSTGDAKDLSWADVFIEELAADYGGSQIKNGNVGDKNYTANQLNFVGDGTIVDLGNSGVGGKEQYQFGSTGDAGDFFDDVKAIFGPGGDRGAVINEAIESIAEDLGGTQINDGKVSVNYTANQIKLVGDKTMVDLGNQGVGGKERYDFDDQATAQKFIDLVRDAVGVEGTPGKLVDEFVFKVSGGAGINGSPTFVGKDEFVEFIGDEFGGTRTKDGAVSESFNGGAKIIGDGTDVKLGPSGVGGKEIWDFDTVADATGFAATLDDLFG